MNNKFFTGSVICGIRLSKFCSMHNVFIFLKSFWDNFLISSNDFRMFNFAV